MKKVAIIGGGPGGYVTAIRLQQYGINVTVFEKERLGGVCLNWGCIPTKSLVKVADLYHEINHSKSFGISVENPKIDYSAVYQRKNKVVEQLVSGVEFMFKKRNIPNIKCNVERIKKVEGGYSVETDSESYIFDYIVIATGSEPKELPFMKFDGERILSSRHILAMDELPKSLAIVGGGVIGCEFASIYAQMGVTVHIIEFLPRLVSMEDEEISKRLAMALKKNKIKLHLKTGVEGFEKTESGINLKLSNGKELETEKVLVSVGRKPRMEVEFTDCQLTMNKGFIEIDENMHTNLPDIYAIGDVTGKLMLAHTASKQGLIVADILANKIAMAKHNIKQLNYVNIPACTFTNPEIGSVGLTEEDAIAKYDEILIGKFPFSANGKSLGMGNNFGFVKVIADKKSQEIVGMHIIGPQATELIAQGTILIGTKADPKKVKEIVFAHPTLSEVVMEAVEDLENLAIHKL